MTARSKRRAAHRAALARYEAAYPGRIPGWLVVGYEEALFRATYYRWAATRGHVELGGDPVTGRKRNAHRELDRAEGAAAAKALARFWLTEARRRRVPCRTAA